MIMNYVLSFCKITAASRIFSRNFYLPLLKPITPKDALRTFKITGKWLLGSKIQHYIPVLYNHKRKRSKRIKNFGKVTHKYDDSFTYMGPMFDDDNESHRKLKGIIEAKHPNGAEDSCYIYTVDDKMTNIVFPGKFELAIQDGDIIDILISQSDDKVLVKMKDFKKIPLPLQYYDKDDLNGNLVKGEGATTVEEEKFHHHGKMTMKLAKIFEAKEMAEEWEQEMIKIVAKKKKQKGEGTKEWQEMVSQTIENINWQQFEVEAKKVIDQIWEPAHEEHIGMVVEDLEKTRNVPEFFNKAGNALLCCLPTLTEIPDVVKNMATAVYEELEDDTGMHRVSGVRVTLSSGKECFITGQMVKTDEGDVFIPGQTIENEFGLSYAPGMTVMLDGKPQLIKGLIMGEASGENGGEQKPMFLPTESSITTDGALTFCRNPEELSMAQPHKIFVKRKNKKKKKKKTNEVNELNGEHNVPETDVQKTEQIKQETELELLKEVESFQVVVNDLDVIAEGEEPTDEQTDQNDDDHLAYDIIPVIEPIITVEAITDAEKTQSEEDLDEFIKMERLVELQELQQLELEQSKVHEIEETQLTESTKAGEEFSFKNPDDGMEKLIGNLEDKKSELQEKLEELRRLSVILENSVTYIQPVDAENLATQITSDEDQQHKIAEILFTLSRRAYMFRERMNVNIKNIHNLSVYSDAENTKSSFADIDDRFDQASIKLKRTLMSALFAANEVFKTRPKDQQLALKTLATIIQNEIGNDKDIEELCTVWMDRDEVCSAALSMLTQKVRECKVDLLNQLADEFEAEKCTDILDCGSVLAVAIKKLSKNSPEVREALQLELQTKIDTVKTECDAKEALQLSIRDACTAYAEELLMHFNIHDEFEYDEVTQEAIGLAGTLGLYEVQEVLGNRKEVLKLLKRKSVGCDKARDFLQRFLLIRELCHKDYSVKSSLERIRKHPECGRKDPRIRQLLIESACLMSKQRDLRSSLEIPLQLFKEQNFLAIEDSVYLRARVDAPIVISRKGIQCVVPKEAAKNVLAGRVAYTLIDESGVTNFKPMHMFKMAHGRKNKNYVGGSTDVRRNSLSDARMAA